jgi:hypothetical protein
MESEKTVMASQMDVPVVSNYPSNLFHEAYDSTGIDPLRVADNMTKAGITLVRLTHLLLVPGC